jgi:hypothetical protein
LHRSPISGTITTSLPEDVFSIINAQTNLIDEYLVGCQLLHTEQGDEVLIDSLLAIFRIMWHKQTHFRDSFLHDLESCIAAANDFLRMIEKVDMLLFEMSKKYPHLQWKEGKASSTALLRREAVELISLFGSDAVYAAQRASTFVMRAIQQSTIPKELFSREWEDKMVHNEVAVSMVRTYEDFLTDIHNWIGQDFLYHKIIVALVRSTVCFYIKCFVQKADTVRRQNKIRRRDDFGFLSASRAICRIMYDIEVLRDYFYNLAKESAPLGRVVANELSVLFVILECMWLAVGGTGADSLEEFVVVVHKRTGANSNVTEHFLSDLWLMCAPFENQHVIHNAVKAMGPELQMVTTRMREKDAASPWKVSNSSSADVSCLTLDDMLLSFYEDISIQQKSSICGNIVHNLKDLRGNRKRQQLLCGEDIDNLSENSPASDALFDKLKDKLEPLRRLLGEASPYAGKSL